MPNIQKNTKKELCFTYTHSYQGKVVQFTYKRPW